MCNVTIGDIVVQFNNGVNKFHTTFYALRITVYFKR